MQPGGSFNGEMIFFFNSLTLPILKVADAIQFTESTQ